MLPEPRKGTGHPTPQYCGSPRYLSIQYSLVRCSQTLDTSMKLNTALLLTPPYNISLIKINIETPTAFHLSLEILSRSVSHAHFKCNAQLCFTRRWRNFESLLTFKFKGGNACNLIVSRSPRLRSRRMGKELVSLLVQVPTRFPPGKASIYEPNGGSDWS